MVINPVSLAPDFGLFGRHLDVPPPRMWINHRRRRQNVPLPVSLYLALSHPISESRPPAVNQRGDSRAHAMPSPNIVGYRRSGAYGCSVCVAEGESSGRQRSGAVGGDAGGGRGRRMTRGCSRVPQSPVTEGAKVPRLPLPSFPVVSRVTLSCQPHPTKRTPRPRPACGVLLSVR